MLTPPQLPARPPSSLTLQNIIDSIPPPKCVMPVQRPFLIVLGKPGTGKTLLAKRLAETYTANLVSPETILSVLLGPKYIHRRAESVQALDEEDVNAVLNSEYPSELVESLLNGRELHTRDLSELYLDMTLSEASTHRGVVIEGLPVASIRGTKKAGEDEDLVLISSILKECPKNCKPILISLSFSEEDLISRRLAQWIDPKTATLYPGQQVEYSKRRRSEGWTDDVPDAEAVVEAQEDGANWTIQTVSEENRPNDGGEDGDAGEEEGEEEVADGEVDGEENESGGGTRKKKKEPRPRGVFNLSNKKTWPILGQNVLDRLIKRPEDVIENILKELRDYQRKETVIKELAAKHFDEFHVIDLDASQHPDLLVRNATHRLEQLGCPSIIRPTSARLVIAPERDSATTDEEYIKILCTLDLAEREQREVSHWGRFCPVTFEEDGVLVQSSLKFPVTYQGLLYFCDSKLHSERFANSPDIFLSTPPKIPAPRMCVIGGPFTGKSLQSQMLAKIYGVRLLCLDSIFEQWTVNPQKQAQTPVFARILKELVAGRAATSEDLAMILKAQIEDESKGWVIDGFPRTLDDVNAMISCSLIPQSTIILQSDINDEIIRARSTRVIANSKTGELWMDSISKAFTPMSFAPSPPRSARNSRSAPRSRGSRGGRPRTTDINGDEVVKVKPPPMMPSKDDSPELPIKMYPYFDNLYNGFKEEFEKATRILNESHGSQTISISADQSIPTILSLIQKALDPFLPKAVPIPSQDFAALSEKSTFEFGFTKDFCPFALRQANILKTGSQQFAAKYLGQYYYLSSEEARIAFCNEPHNFVNFRAPMKPPPPRLFFFGPTGAGKTVCMQALSSRGFPILNFAKIVDEFKASATTLVREEMEYTMRENSGLLSPIILQEIITQLFIKEPYKSKGFILEGFPRNKVEVEVLMKHNLHVDAYVVLNVEPEVAAKRVAAGKLKEAKEQVKLIQALIDADDGSQNESTAAENLKRLAAAHANLTEVEAKHRDIMDEIVDAVERENMRVQDIMTAVQSLTKSSIVEIDCNRGLRPVVGSLKNKLLPYLDHRMSIFSNAVVIDEAEAEYLLSSGYKSYSSFLKTCPVSMYKLQSAFARPAGKLPVLHGDHIYFLSDSKHRDEFLGNILKFISQPPPKLVVPPKIMIVGRPKSGKTDLAAKISAEYNLVHLTIPLIIDSIIAGKENTRLWKEISTKLSQGQDISDRLVCEAIALVTSRAVCQARGWILDGFLESFQSVQALEDLKVVPNLIVELNESEEDMISRAVKDANLDALAVRPTQSMEKYIRERDGNYQKDIEKIQNHYTTTYQNWISLDAAKSKWALKSRLKEIIESSTERRQNYFSLRTNGKAAPVADIGISLVHISENLSKFESYCPVSLLDNGELVQGPTNTRFTAEYENLYYRMASEDELQKFLACPERYCCAPDLPEDLPIRRKSSDLVFPAQIELLGYCPVTLVEGPPGFDSIIQGNPDMIAEYESKFFCMANEMKLDKFMRKPWDYADVVLPKKLPPKIIPIPTSMLPLTGYMERTVAKPLTDALSAVGRDRPKHPFKSIQSSAVEYMAIFLKARNPKSKEWVRGSYEARLKKFKSRCQLISDIASVTSKAQYSYIPVQNRELGLDKSMERFFAMSGLTVGKK